MTDDGIIKAPWTDQQVNHLNHFQDGDPFGHPYTCGNEECPAEEKSVLLATREGWVCGFCDYTQDWAHEIPVWTIPADFYDKLMEDECEDSPWGSANLTPCGPNCALVGGSGCDTMPRRKGNARDDEGQS